MSRFVCIIEFVYSHATHNNNYDVYLLPLHCHTHAQVQILSRIKHPYIISMVAVTLRPKAMLFLEFAELGSLASLYPYSNLSNTLKHRIAFQVLSPSLASAHIYVPMCQYKY